MGPAPAARGPVPWFGTSLRRQLSLVAVGLVLLASVLFLALVAGEYRARILADREEASLNVNLLLQAALENAMLKRDLDGLQQIVARLGAQETVAGVMIATPAGEVRFASDPDRIGAGLGAQVTGAAATGQRSAEFLTLPGGEVLRSVNPVANQPQCGGCHGPVALHPVNGVLIVDYDASGVGAAVWQGALMLSGLGAGVLALLVAGLSLAVDRLVVRRLDRLSASAGALAGGALDARARMAGRDELATLGAQFDTMADRLQAGMAELHAARAGLQTLIDAIPDGVRVIDAQYRIVMANRAYARQIGAEPGAETGAEPGGPGAETGAETGAPALCYASSHARHRPCVPTLVTCPVAEILGAGQGALTCTHVHRDRNGSDVSVEVSAAPVTLRIDGEDRPCVVEAIRDMDTDLAISQKQRLAEMGSLAAGVAHEVNNPLSSIALALKSVQSEESLSTGAEASLQVAEVEIENLRRITESLLRLTVLPQGAPELVDLGAVIRETAALVGFEAASGGVEIALEIAGCPRLLAQDSDIRNLVFNLALNAVHAMPDGGRLRLACWHEAGWNVIEVEDTGVGIPVRDQAKILMPFWTRRADGSRGRGLGLAICSSVVKGLGGRLAFRSELGVGTCFTVELPDRARGGG